MIAGIKAAGFDGVELQDATVTPAEARAARRLAEEAGITIHSFLGPDAMEAQVNWPICRLEWQARRKYDTMAHDD